MKILTSLSHIPFVYLDIDYGVKCKCMISMTYEHPQTPKLIWCILLVFRRLICILIVSVGVWAGVDADADVDNGCEWLGTGSIEFHTHIHTLTLTSLRLGSRSLVVYIPKHSVEFFLLPLSSFLRYIILIKWDVLIYLIIN